MPRFNPFDHTRAFACGLAVLTALGVGLALYAPSIRATTSSPSAASPMAGNGHNISFDGRLFVVRRGPDSNDGGWFATLLRPERISTNAAGLPDMTTGAFSTPTLIQPFAYGENALALCEPNPDDTPYRCNAEGARVADGPFACYDLRVIDSNAYPNQNNSLRRRHLKLWVSEPSTSNAEVSHWEWVGGLDNLSNTRGEALKGIEPTVTRDGRMLLWQGHPSNDGQIDILMYATNDNPCGVGGWDGPHNLSHMYNDPRVRGQYRLAERPLRAADGAVFQDGDVMRGAYPWLFPEGDALIFAAVQVPCRSENDPVGCGPRRGGMSILGYPTNWAIGHIDGGINPDTDNTVRLFFSSPGPNVFSQIPATPGVDVWPFFGSNTSNYTEVMLDDGIDGQYAGVWLMNESINTSGNLDRSRTPDTSGYFNTGVLRGATFPLRNNAPGGKAIEFNGTGSHVEVPHSSSLNPVNGITVEMVVFPNSPVDCGEGNNYRYMMGKGGFDTGAYSLVFEENELFQFRVRAGGEQRAVWTSTGIPVGQWSRIAFTYNATTGQMQSFINGQLAQTTMYPPAPLDGSNDPLRIGAAASNFQACRPEGHGAFQGAIDEVRISRTVRDIADSILPGNHGTFVSQQLPGEVVAGQPFEASFTFRNNGTTIWTTEGRFRLGSQNPQDTGRWGTGRVALPNEVRPGQQVTFQAQLTAPAELGPHPMQWRMVQDAVAWFGEFTPNATLNVVAFTEPDVGMDTEPPMEDTSTEPDTTVTEDTSSPDTMQAEDTTAPPQDTMVEADTMPGMDTMIEADTEVEADTTAADTEVEPDAVIEADTTTAPDTTLGADAQTPDTTTVNNDTSATEDDTATVDEPIVAPQTASGCSTARSSPQSSTSAMLFGLLLLALVWVRR